jgi:hypothetical protein
MSYPALAKSPRLNNFIPVPLPVAAMVPQTAALVYGLILKQFLWEGEPPTISLTWYAERLGVSAKIIRAAVKQLVDAALIGRVDIAGQATQYQVLEHPAVFGPADAAAPRPVDDPADSWDAPASTPDPCPNGKGVTTDSTPTPSQMGRGPLPKREGVNKAKVACNPLNQKGLEVKAEKHYTLYTRNTGEAAASQGALALELVPPAPLPEKFPHGRKTAPPPGYTADDITAIVGYLNRLRDRQGIGGKRACWTDGIEVTRSAGGRPVADLVRWLDQQEAAGAFRGMRSLGGVKWKLGQFFFHSTGPVAVSQPDERPRNLVQDPLNTIPDEERVAGWCIAYSKTVIGAIDEEATAANLARVRSCPNCHGHGRVDGVMCQCEAADILAKALKRSGFSLDTATALVS